MMVMPFISRSPSQPSMAKVQHLIESPWCLHVLWWRSIPLKPFYYDVRSLPRKTLNFENWQVFHEMIFWRWLTPAKRLRWNPKMRISIYTISISRGPFSRFDLLVFMGVVIAFFWGVKFLPPPKKKQTEIFHSTILDGDPKIHFSKWGFCSLPFRFWTGFLAND